MQQYSNKYIFGFTALVCLGCSMMISIAAVGLKDRQELNKALYQKRSVLQACWLIKPGEKVSAEQIEKYFDSIQTVIIDLKSGTTVDGVDMEKFNAADTLAPAPDDSTGMLDLPTKVKGFLVKEGDTVKTLVLPIVGKGLWSTMKGYIALDRDTTTIRGLTFYEQGETPGLGGEVDNPKWKKLWKGRKAYDENWKVAISVEKGNAGPPEQDPYRVDALSSATLTSRGVNNLVRYWLGENGYGPYLKHFRESRSS